MIEHLQIDQGTLVYDVTGEGPLVVLAHGMGDSRHSYRFLAPLLVEAGYRVANLDIRGSGDSSLGWDDYSRTAMGGDMVALIRKLGGPAVIIGQSISGGAATVAAASAPDLVAGLIELAPFTRAQSIPLGAMITVRRYRQGSVRLMRTMVLGSLTELEEVPRPGGAGQAGRLGQRAGAHRGQAERAGSDEGAAGHDEDRPRRRRGEAGRRGLPGARGPGKSGPRLGGPARGG